MLASTLLINRSFWRTKTMASKFAHTRVLVVDSDPALRELMLDCLRKIGVHYFCTATNGQEAMRFLGDSSHNFHAVFTGKDMPVKDGEELIKELRTKSHLNHIGVAMTTDILTNRGGMSDEEIRLRTFLGATQVMPFPRDNLSPTTLAQALNEMTGA